MGYVVIDIEADGDVAQQALLAMKAIRAPSAPVCCTNLLLPHGQVAYLPVFFLTPSGRNSRTRITFYQRQVLPGVITAGSGISHCSLGSVPTCWQSWA
ncbi:D-3-phosphoglycerate dehydrogenase (plasmid) [Klebsiella aerogenes]|nr:D-3-phosphoglycerate dehydrogenase [Klebsiella aerogenes]